MPVPEIQPAHDIQLGIDAHIIGFSPHGRLYVEVAEFSLNLWSVLIYFWPEILGALLAISAIVLISTMIRAVRRPQLRGEVYCRRCNYNLSGLKNESPCPECGNASLKRKAVKGRTFRGRIALPAGAFMLAGLTYGAILFFGVSRKNAAFDVFFWPAPLSLSFVNDYLPEPLSSHARLQRFLVEINPKDAGAVRVVRAFDTMTPVATSLSPDGQTIIATLKGGEMAAISTKTGRMIQTLSSIDGYSISPFAPFLLRRVAGWISPTELCLQVLCTPANFHSLYRWDITTGALGLLLKTPLPTVSPLFDQPLPQYETHHLHLIPGSVPLAAWEFLDGKFEKPALNPRSALRICDVLNGGAVLREVPIDNLPGSAPLWRGDSGEFFSRSSVFSCEIDLISSRTGECIDTLTVPGIMFSSSDRPAGCAYHDPSGRLFITTRNPDVIHVRDTRSKEWVAQLSFGPYSSPDSCTAVSPNGRWAALGVTQMAGTPWRRRDKGHVLIFDLDSINPPASSTPNR